MLPTSFPRPAGRCRRDEPSRSEPRSCRRPSWDTAELSTGIARVHADGAATIFRGMARWRSRRVVRGLTERRTVLVDAAVARRPALLLLRCRRSSPAGISPTTTASSAWSRSRCAHGVAPVPRPLLAAGPAAPRRCCTSPTSWGSARRTPRGCCRSWPAIAVTIATYAAAATLTSRYGAIVAALLVTTSGSCSGPRPGSRPTAPPSRLGGRRWRWRSATRSRPHRACAVATGLCAGAAVATKALAGPVLLPVGLLLLSARWSPRERSSRASPTPPRAAWASTSSSARAARSSPPCGARAACGSSRSSTTGAPPALTSYWGAVTKVVTTLVERDLLLLVVAGLAVVVAVVALARSAPATDAAPVERPPFVFRPVTILAAWLVAQLAVLVVEPAMWRPHVAPPRRPDRAARRAATATTRPRPRRGGRSSCRGTTSNLQPMLCPGAFDRGGGDRACAPSSACPTTASSSATSPASSWRSGHRIPADFDDSSIKRIEQARSPRRSCSPRPRDRDVCAVLVWTDRYRDLELGPRLDRESAHEARPLRRAAPYELYERSGCRA